MSVCQSYPEKVNELGPTVPEGVPPEEPEPEEPDPEEPLPDVPEPEEPVPEEPLPEVPVPEEPVPPDELVPDPLPDDPLLEVPLPDDPLLVPVPLPVPVDPLPVPVPPVDPLCGGVTGIVPPPHPTRNRAANNKAPILSMKFLCKTGIGTADPLRPEELRGPKNIKFQIAEV